MTTWVEWIEPFGPNNEPVYCRVEASTAIAVRKELAAKLNHVYVNDEDALLDFIAVHWADVIEE
jgi:hypothetical protein